TSKAGRTALAKWIPALAVHLESRPPPRGMEELLQRLNYPQLAFMALRALLDRIYGGWDLKNRKRKKPINPIMSFCLQLGRAVRNEFEFAGLLAAREYVLAAPSKHKALAQARGWKFRGNEWTNRECALIGDWLWGCLDEMDCFEVDGRGYPKIAD